MKKIKVSVKKLRKQILVILFFIIVLTSLYVIKIYNRPTNYGQDNLHSLPYIHYGKEVADFTESSVVVYDIGKSYPGFTLIDKTLIDMEGNVILTEQGHYFDYLDKSYYSYNPKKAVFKYDKDMNLLWEFPLLAHHDLEILYDSVLVVSRKLYEYNGKTFFFDEINEISKQGEVISTWSTYTNLKEIKKHHEKIDSFIDVEGEPYPDYYHMNAITVIPETELSELDKRFQKGNWIVSLHTPNLILILDKDSKEIVWSFGPGEIVGQHKPVVLPSGNIVVLDNGRGVRNYSRIVEIDPFKKEIVWEYKSNPVDSFYTAFGGYIQELPNGNILVTETEKGRVFEVTREKEIVWEWYNPEIDKEGYRVMVSKAERFPESVFSEFMVS